ncbi:hypothetical protein [Clavibacter michiganensis]|uniref:hypothetical protein n=1 Tax=Clavibacter michiganensis TaxID=28447 RepID=UPI003DA0AFCA
MTNHNGYLRSPRFLKIVGVFSLVAAVGAAIFAIIIFTQLSDALVALGVVMAVMAVSLVGTGISLIRLGRKVQ